eukprot:TRINITY_DN8656_c0_g1_i1.p1 TRINITY_DN8656_c0_g1~~TRINITY_DN8656_c0_g1_i1.p1  ORF type:complete len:198 (+),score=42.20 TRINITY_DN8656_c0_g1_i1:45-596(+)
MKQKQLFGGAITVDLEDRFFDISAVREVPDNQEVFCDADKDQTVIIEILSMPEMPDMEAAEYHFEDIANANEAQSFNVVDVSALTEEDMPHFDDSVRKLLLTGTQTVSKYNEKVYNEVNIYMGILRIEKVQADILITLNSGASVHPESSASINLKSVESHESNESLIRAILRSFNITDWGLFA